MFVSTINAISQSGQAYSHKNLGPARSENSAAAPLQKARKIPGHGEKSYLPLPKKELTHPFLCSDVRPGLLGNHLPLEFRDLFQPLAA